MKTTVVCGLLGAGKTTFIRNFVNGRAEKTVVLVNDVGKAGIDGEIFSADGIDSVELPGGCVCCTLKVDLIATIQRIVRQFSPEHLLIEPSGVASPSGVLEALEIAGIGSPSVIGIADATEFTELYESGMYGSFFEDQIRNSDVILVNKTDLTDEATITTAERLIGSINPIAVLLRTVHAAVNIPLPDTSRQYLFRERIGLRGLDPERDESVGTASQVHLHFDTLSLKLNDMMDPASMRKLFEDLAKGRFGLVARAKALVNTSKGPFRFDCSFGKVDMARFRKNIGESRLVVIGEKLNATEIQMAMVLSQPVC